MPNTPLSGRLAPSPTRPPRKAAVKAAKALAGETEAQTTEAAPARRRKKARLFEVERIAGEKTRRGQRLFLVQWRGYEEKTWEPESHLTAELVAEWTESRDGAEGAEGAEAAEAEAADGDDEEEGSGARQRRQGQRPAMGKEEEAEGEGGAAAGVKEEEKAVEAAEAKESPEARPRPSKRRRPRADEAAAKEGEGAEKEASHPQPKRRRRPRRRFGLSAKKRTSTSAAEGEAEWEVEAVVGRRRQKGGQVQFLVRWRDYEGSDATSWVDEADCTCPDLIAAFLDTEDRTGGGGGGGGGVVIELLDSPQELLAEQCGIEIEDVTYQLQRQASEAAEDEQDEEEDEASEDAKAEKGRPTSSRRGRVEEAEEQSQATVREDGESEEEDAWQGEEEEEESKAAVRSVAGGRGAGSRRLARSRSPSVLMDRVRGVMGQMANLFHHTSASSNR